MLIDEVKVPIQVYTLQSGEAPVASIRDNVVVVGEQEFTFENGNLTPKVFAAQ